MKMTVEQIMKHVDHTLLKQTATREEIREICNDARKYRTASVCIPPCYVAFGAECLKGEIPVCTVIGFPNGNSTTEIKCAEAAKAIEDGAEEIDMVINIGWLRDGEDEKVLAEIKALKNVCGEKILKVIIETCLLTEDEKIRMCRIVTESGADYIKTSTGFAGGGATFEDISLFKKHVGANVRIKAAGGIKSFEDAEHFMELGADRLGTSRLVALLKSEHESTNY